MEVNNIFVTYSYNVCDVEKIPASKNCLGREGLLLHRLSQGQKKKHAILLKVYLMFSEKKSSPNIIKPSSPSSIIN